jgi:hypothetical protein
MPSFSLAEYLREGPSSAAEADANDIYLDRATGNLVVRLSSGAQLQISPTGQILSSGGYDLVAGLIAPSTPQIVNGGYETNQRGGTVTANNQYAHDRWQILLGGTSTITVTDETTIVDTGSAHALKAVYVHNAASQIDQKLEGYAQLRGRQVTFRVRVRAGVVGSARPYVDDSGVKTYGTANTATGAYGTLTVTATIGAAASGVRVGVELGASDTVYLDNASLAFGATPLLYAPVDPALELLRCQRYYYVITGSPQYVCPMLSYAATTALGAFMFPTEMAVAPTITVPTPSDWSVLDGAANSIACTALAGVTITVRSCRFNATVAGGLTAGQASMLKGTNASPSPTITFEANP